MRVLDLSKFRNAASLSSGRHASVFSGEGVEFWGLRSYSESDDSRAIDWKASLRSGKTLVKTFVPDREVPVWCIIDVSAPMGFWEVGKTRFDQALSVFELLSASSLRSWNRFWAMAYAGNRFRVLKPTLSASEVRRFSKILRNEFESLPPEMSSSVPWSSISRYIRMRSVVFFLSDLHPEFPVGIRKMLRRSHLFSVRIAHPYDERPPKFGFPAIFEGFFPKIVGRASVKGQSEETPTPSRSIPHAEIEIGKDPFLDLNRLLSAPGA